MAALPTGFQRVPPETIWKPRLAEMGITPPACRCAKTGTSITSGLSGVSPQVLSNLASSSRQLRTKRRCCSMGTSSTAAMARLRSTTFPAAGMSSSSGLATTFKWPRLCLCPCTRTRIEPPSAAAHAGAATPAGTVAQERTSGCVRAVAGEPAEAATPELGLTSPRAVRADAPEAANVGGRRAVIGGSRGLGPTSSLPTGPRSDPGPMATEWQGRA
mmetsp:Transcript_92721/g.235830  ORF Transcript_92721/g.235830 Transcript_92721/m.235830 type:complete len:216 (-) Transcript_92721:33-680(-)